MKITRLVHKNPKLNNPALWYRVIDDRHPDWFYATIWGKEGIVNSTIHAVPKSDYTTEEVKEKKAKADDINLEDFI